MWKARRNCYPWWSRKSRNTQQPFTHSQQHPPEEQEIAAVGFLKRKEENLSQILRARGEEKPHKKAAEKRNPTWADKSLSLISILSKFLWLNENHTFFFTNFLIRAQMIRKWKNYIDNDAAPMFLGAIFVRKMTLYFYRKMSVF